MNSFDYALAGFLIDEAVAGGAGFILLQRVKVRLVVERLIESNMDALTALNMLRSGNAQAASEFAEKVLNNSVVSMAKLVSRSRTSKLDQSLLFHLTQAKDYRQKFPHKSTHDGVDWRVARAFSLVDRATSAGNAQLG